MIWLVGLVIVVIVGIGGTIYLSWAIGRFGLIQKASGEKKWLSRLIAFAVLLTGFALFAVLLSVTDGIPLKSRKSIRAFIPELCFTLS